MLILIRIFLCIILLYSQSLYSKVLPDNLVKDDVPVYDVVQLIKIYGGKLKRKNIGAPLYTNKEKDLTLGIKFDCIKSVALTEISDFLDLDNCAAIITIKHRFDIFNF